jgi:D-methionine transport system substrate-binding protein
MFPKLLLVLSLMVGQGVSAVNEKLKVGVTVGPHAMIMEQVKKEAEKQGLDLEIVEFNDFILPNRALQEGDIQVNSYQHSLFLEEQRKQGLALKAVAKTVLMPMGIYSAQKDLTLQKLPPGSKIAIPNDPTNEGRALKLLEKAGLLRLKANIKNPTLLDIEENPKDLTLVELEAPQIPRALPDVAVAVINMDWIILAGIDPRSALLKEDPTDAQEYVNLLVVRQEDKGSPALDRLIKAYQSEPVRQYIEKTFKGALLCGWP